MSSENLKDRIIQWYWKGEVGLKARDSFELGKAQTTFASLFKGSLLKRLANPNNWLGGFMLMGQYHEGVPLTAEQISRKLIESGIAQDDEDARSLVPEVVSSKFNCGYAKGYDYSFEQTKDRTNQEPVYRLIKDPSY